MTPTGPGKDIPRLHALADDELIDAQDRRLVVRVGLGRRGSDLRLCQAANRILLGLQHRTISAARTVERDEERHLVLTYDTDDTEPLSTRLHDAPGCVVHVLAQVCDALDAAHSLGVIHGALTPDSVRLGPDAQRPTVRITDFGLGHLFGPHCPIQARPQWLPYSPEKQLGLEPTPSEDVYLLGSLGYTMVTGKPLFQATTRLETLRRHAIESATDIAGGQLDCAPWLADVLDRCLQKEASERYATPAEVAEALRAGQAQAALAQDDAHNDAPPSASDRDADTTQPPAEPTPQTLEGVEPPAEDEVVVQLDPPTADLEPIAAAQTPNRFRPTILLAATITAVAGGIAWAASASPTDLAPPRSQHTASEAPEQSPQQPASLERPEPTPLVAQPPRGEDCERAPDALSSGAPA
ncbi:MAG: hypothetical protein KUG77_03690, partial [Nannocystaceae bacterium]|nr:hypothetical protein [Nannocystaceae bacterium]